MVGHTHCVGIEVRYLRVLEPCVKGIESILEGRAGVARQGDSWAVLKCRSLIVNQGREFYSVKLFAAARRITQTAGVEGLIGLVHAARIPAGAGMECLRMTQ